MLVFQFGADGARFQTRARHFQIRALASGERLPTFGFCILANINLACQ